LDNIIAARAAVNQQSARISSSPSSAGSFVINAVRGIITLYVLLAGDTRIAIVAVSLASAVGLNKEKEKVIPTLDRGFG